MTATAGFVVIGDEILTGKVQDTNSHSLAQVLFTRGVRLSRIEVIPDVIDEIAATVKRASSAYTHVFTSGGIGPTHDDMTYEGIARAFGRKLVLHEPTVEKMRAHYSLKPEMMNEARLRMALLPEGCEIWETDGLWVPLVVVENVHVLPGVPMLFKGMLEAAAHRFVGVPLTRELVYTMGKEGDIAAPLAALAAAHPDIAIGSYPRDGGDHKVMISLEGPDARAVADLAARVADAIGGFRR
jgi:molybdenum cofactor synthesis domain-containing protein